MTQYSRITMAHPSMGDSAQKLGDLLHTLQPAGISAGSRVSFQSDSGLNLFLAAWLVSASPEQLVLSQESSL